MQNSKMNIVKFTSLKEITTHKVFHEEWELIQGKINNLNEGEYLELDTNTGKVYLNEVYIAEMEPKQ